MKLCVLTFKYLVRFCGLSRPAKWSLRLPKGSLYYLALAAGLALCLPGTATAWTFIHITDLHVGEDPNGVAFEKMVNHIKTLSPRPSFVIATGDLVSDGMNSDGSINTANWQSLTRSIIKHPDKNMWYLERTGSPPYNYSIPIYFTPGNHDSRYSIKTFNLAGYDQYIYNPKTPDGCTPGTGDAARDYYFVNYGALMVSLYSGVDNGLNTTFPHSDGLKQAQIDFLNLAVKNNPACKAVIIFMHHSAVDNQDNGLIDNKRTVFLDSLDRWSTRFKVVVLHGHIHGDAELGRNGNPWTSGPVFVRSSSAKGDWYRKIDFDQGTGSINIYASAQTTNPQPNSQIVTPGNGTIVSGTTVPIVVSVSSPVGIKSVNVTVNGTSLGTKTSGPWQWLWDLLGFKATNCNITATVTDNNNNVTKSTITVIKGSQTYYNRLNVGGTVGVTDPKDGHTANCVLTSIEVIGGYRYVNLSVDGLNHQVKAGEMKKVNNGNSGLFIYPATIFDGATGEFSDIMIAPYQYPSIDIIVPEPGISTNNAIVWVAANYSGKNVPWQGTGAAPANPEFLKTITYNGANGYLPSSEYYTWIMSGTAGSRTMKAVLTDKFGTSASKSVTVNYNPALAFRQFYGPYGDEWKSLSITYYWDGSRYATRVEMWKNNGANTYLIYNTNWAHNKEEEIRKDVEFIASVINGSVAPGGVSVFVVDKTQYQSGSWTSGLGFGTITYKEFYDQLAHCLGKDSEGKFRVWASASAAARSSADAITPPVPPAPALSLPANGQSLTTSNDVLLQWSVPVQYNATNYEVKINTTVYSTTTTSYNAGKLGAGNYTWQVRAKNIVGWGSWSSTRSFTMIAPPPAVNGVVNGDFSDPLGAGWQWGGVAGISGYGQVGGNWPCGWLKQSFNLPSNASLLIYDVASQNNYPSSTFGYARLLFNGVEQVRCGYQCSSIPMQTRSLDITAYRGQTKEFYLETGPCYGGGTNSWMQVDNVAILAWSDFFADNFGDNDISDWGQSIVQQVPQYGSSASIIADAGRMRLYAGPNPTQSCCYTCGSATAYKDLGTRTGYHNFCFDWQTSQSNGWPALTVVWQVLVNGTAVYTAALPMGTSGHTEKFLNVNGSVRLSYSVYSTVNCYYNPRSPTYLWVDNVAVKANSITTGKEGVVDDAASLPPVYGPMLSCAPNPFTGQTTINFQLAKPAQTTIKVYNLMGQVVKTLVDECLRPGYHSVKWNGKSDKGKKLAAGVYLYRMESGSYSATKKLTVIR